MTNSDGPGQQHTPLGLGEFVTGLTSLFESAESGFWRTGNCCKCSWSASVNQ